jgi:hypothetical protein
MDQSDTERAGDHPSVSRAGTHDRHHDDRCPNRQAPPVFHAIIADLDQTWNPAGIPQPVEPLEQWMAGSPLVHVTFTKEALI